MKVVQTFATADHSTCEEAKVAISESIKRRVILLEDECAWAENICRCLVQAAGDDPRVIDPIALQFERTVDRLNRRVDSLVKAIHREGGAHG